MTVTLPWPPRELFPNSRVHWGARARAAKAYRHACWALAKEAGIVAPESERIHLFVDFVPPDRRRRDQDGMISAMKSGFDGLADAMGVDDNRFRVHPYVADEIGGLVRVRIAEGP